MNSDGTPIGEAASTFPQADENAGQPQMAVGADGKSIVAFLADHSKGYEVMVRGMMCKASH